MFRSAAVVFMSLLILAGPVAAQDAREPVARTQAERNFILGQMRLFLGSVQAISSALARNDLKTVAAEATARGRRGTPLSEVPPGLKAKETPAWGALMGGVRAGFDKMADAAAEDAPPAQIMGMMGEAMQNCVACHHTYRLVGE